MTTRHSVSPICKWHRDTTTKVSMLSSISYPCASKNKHVHNTSPMASFTPTSSASVELLVLIFCLAENEKMDPRPMLTVAPVWLRRLGWTPKEASTHHRIMLDEYNDKIRGRSRVFLRYRRQRPSFFQSSSSACCTRVVRNATAVCRSGRVRLLR